MGGHGGQPWKVEGEVVAMAVNEVGGDGSSSLKGGREGGEKSWGSGAH